MLRRSNVTNDYIETYLKKVKSETQKQKTFIRNMDSFPHISIKGFSGDFFADQPVNIGFQYSKQEIHLQRQKVYLSLFEKTTNFGKLPTSSKTMLYGNELYIKFDTVISGFVNCSLYLMFYDQQKMIDSHVWDQVGKTLEATIQCPNEAVSFRVAIRLEGEGSIQLNQLLIKQGLSFNNSKQTRNEIVQDSSAKIEKFKEKIKGLKYYRKVRNNGLKVATILDDFSYECFRYECDLLPLSKDNWKEEIQTFKPDFLFVESCWQGNKGEWAYEVANLHINKHRTKLKELTDYCKQEGIKTVFWDKEGCENFDFFKTASEYFDYIFTADENNIQNFKHHTGNENVFVLPFAAQPQIHNPIYRNRNYLGSLAFAGSYYNNKHDLRKKDIENLIKPSLKYGIDIFDRYYGKDPQKYPNNQWPEEYRKNIVGSLDYAQMVEAYKNYDIFINVNSVQNSKYMFARRVFELLASGTMVVSGPSVGVEEMFKGYVPIAKSEKEINNLLKIYLKNPDLRRKVVKEGFRFVLRHHTYRNRLQEICDRIGIKANLLQTPKVSIVSSTQREEFMLNLFHNIRHQTYENIEVIIVLNKNSMNISKWEKQFNQLDCKVKILKIDENFSLGHCLNEAIKHSNGEIIAKFDDDDYYAPNYLLDMVLAMDYSNADIVGKSAHYVYIEEKNMLVVKTVGSGAESYSDFVSGATLVFKREVFEQLNGFADRSRGEDTDLLLRAKEKGFLIYSNDSYNFCLYRRADTGSHTWKVDTDEILRNSHSHSFTTDYKTPVTI
jgi:spore maturation protein CgeB